MTRLREGLRLCLVVTLFVIGTNFSRADLASSAEFRDAVQFLTEGMPSLAEQKLEFLLNEKDRQFTNPEKERITLLLLEALVRSGDNERALTLFSRTPTFQQRNNARFWQALALKKSDRIDEAETILKELIVDPKFQYLNWATLTLAQISANRHDLETVDKLLQPLLTSDQPKVVSQAQLTGAEFYLQHNQDQAALALLDLSPPYKKSTRAQNSFRFLRARIAMLQSNFPKAIFYLEDFREVEDLGSRAIHEKAVLLLGDACAATGRKQDAIDHWLHLIENHPDNASLPLIFDKLTKTDAFSKPKVFQDLALWAAEDSFHSKRKIYSQYYHALTQNHIDHPLERRKEFESFVETHSAHALYIPAVLELVELLIRQGIIGQAKILLGELKQFTLTPSRRSRVIFLEAFLGFKQGDYVKAESKFLEAGDSPDDMESSDVAAFNVALTALNAGDDKTFTQYRGLLSQSKNTDLQAELGLEQGLFLASRSVTKAFETLSGFLTEFPDHARAADAQLALAELYLNEVPAKPVSAREQLKSAVERQLTRRQEESLNYIAVWIEESDGNHSAVIEQALRYLDHWPRSRHAPEIRLKLGEAYYRKKDFSQAMLAFEQLAVHHPESSLLGPALFSAGKAASLSKLPEDRARAIELWARLAENESTPLALYARHEQGLFKVKLGEVDDAIAAFDSILEHDPPAPLELKLAVLADRGQAMFNIATARDNEPDYLLNAIQSFDNILSDPGTPPSWRNQATVRKAKCLERLGRQDEALDTYSDVVQSDRLTEGADSEAPVAQVEWFFRAGLGAIRILQKKEEWDSAIRIAESLAHSGSPRAIEASRLADRIRLEHFIWDQPER